MFSTRLGRWVYPVVDHSHVSPARTVTALLGHQTVVIGTVTKFVDYIGNHSYDIVSAITGKRLHFKGPNDHYGDQVLKVIAELNS